MILKSSIIICYSATICLAFSLLSIVVDATFNFDGSLVQETRRAYDLSVASYTGGNGFSQGSYYIDSDGSDAAFFLRENNICWAAFRGTDFSSLQDVLQNLNPTNSQICPPSGSCCTARAGFVQGYRGTSYYTTLYNQIHDCKSSCPNCQVILTGHSQGGGIAAVAAVDLADLNPKIITFGQPASIEGTCNAINVNQYYRFVNTDQDSRDFDYDPVPCLNLNADQMGHLIILGNDGSNVASYGNGNTPSISSLDWDFLDHFLMEYGSRLYNLNTNGVATNGFTQGYGCNLNSECRSPNRCIDGENVCSSGADGDPCNNDGNCVSGRCEGILTGLFSGTCEPQLGRNGVCNENSDCRNGNCRFPWFRCN